MRNFRPLSVSKYSVCNNNFSAKFVKPEEVRVLPKFLYTVVIVYGFIPRQVHTE